MFTEIKKIENNIYTVNGIDRIVVSIDKEQYEYYLDYIVTISMSVILIYDDYPNYIIHIFDNGNEIYYEEYYKI